MSRGRILTSSWTALLVAVVLAPVALMQSPPGPRRRSPEEMRRQSAAAEAAGLAEPFKGITADGRGEGGLFGIRSTGVSTEPVRQAAEAFLAGLRPEQRGKTTYDVDDDEWRKWMNQHFYVRQGVSFLEMSDAQREKAIALLRASLSAKGLKQTRDIMRLNHTLGELNDNNFDEYGEWRYHITVMGAPSATEPWGWQLDGHHADINYFVLGDQVVMTPFFAGSEPVVAHAGKYKGVSVLQEEQRAGLAMLNSLDEAQRNKAILKFSKTGNEALTEAWKDNVVLDYAGVRATELSEAQRRQLLDLVALYVTNGDDGHARVRMDEVRKHLDRTWFAWIGKTEPGSVFYYRIHSPVILIEFDHQTPANLRHLAPDPRAPNLEHIHTITRTPNGNDYGKDLLRQHYETHPHHAKDRPAPLPELREEEIGWSANGRDVQGTRYLPATEITRENVGRLEVAWTYRTGEMEERFATTRAASFEATPLVVDVAAHRARRTRRPAVRGLRRAGHGGPDGRPPHPALRARRLFHDLAAGGGERPRGDGLVRRRQHPAHEPQRRGVGLRRPHRRVEVDVGPDPAGPEGPGLRRVARRRGPQERRRQRLVGARRRPRAGPRLRAHRERGPGLLRRAAPG